MNRSRWMSRVGLALTLVAGVSTAWVAMSSSPVHADDNQLILPGGGTHVTLGANAVLRVDGRMRYVNWCDQMPSPYRNTAINDFVYPATDIYVVEGNPAQAEGVLYAKLEDVAGSPSTVVQGGTAFIEHLIAITGPTGALGEGTYSIVFDTCQDGYFQRAYGDEVWPDAITVVYPPVIPDVSDSIAALKSNAHTEWGTWQQVGKTFDTLLNVEKLVGCGTKGVSLSALDNCLSILKIWVDSPTVQAWIEAYGDVRQAAECGSGNPGACFGVLSQYWGPKMQSPRDIVAGGAKNLIANQAKSFFGMYADPPRADFATPTSAAIADLPVPVIHGDSPTFDALSLFASALEREQILNTALLAAVERFQGAQAAGDPVAAVAQARSAAGLAAALAEARPVTIDLLAAFAAAVDAEVPGLDDLNQAGQNDLNRFRNNGPGAEESRTLRNYGMSTPDQIVYVNELRNPARIGLHAWPLQELEARVGALAASNADRVDDLIAAAADLSALANSISGPGVDTVPTITIDPVTPFGVGDVVDFSATASTGATVTWDLDADGAFGDDPTDVTFHVPGHRVIAARATNAAGVTVTAHALVDVHATNAPPAILTATPTDEILAGEVGTPTTFTVTASDPDDAQAELTYQWYLDGTAIDAAIGPSVTITPTPADRGARTVSVTVNDTQPGNIAQRAWRWQVSDVDADGDGWAANAWADCDDTDPNRNPSLVEQLYNGIDDDCSDASPDQPLELAVGQLWGWGTADGTIGTGSNTSSATPRYQGFDNVAQVAARMYGGALLDDIGCVWGWGGQSSWGRVGDGNGALGHTAPTPVSVVAPGTGIGGSQLCGVTQIDGSSNWIASLTVDGRVLTWGNSGNGAIGQGIPHAAQSSYPVPGYVVTHDLVDADDDGNLDPGTPLEGVATVEAGYGSGFALMEDGTVWRWGGGQCGDPFATVYHAVPMPVLDKPDTTIVQIEGGNQSVLARHSDGTVSYCRGSGTLGAPQRLTLDTFDGQRAVDLATTPNASGAFVLTEDGSLWVTGSPSAFQIEPLDTENDEQVSHDGWTRVTLPNGAKLIDLDGAAVPCAILARRADGSAWSWGDTNRNCHGQGDATVLSASNHATPGQLAIAGEVRQVSDGGYSGLAVVGREGADVWTWGTGGVLGRPTAGNAGQTPGPVPGLSNVVELVPTWDPGAHWALKADGSVVGWSPTTFAYFTAPSNNTVQPVKGIGGHGALTGVTHLVSGRSTVAALMSDGHVVTWGFGRDQLGAGPDHPGTLNRLFPDYVLGPDLEPITDVVEMWGGANGYVARQANGTILQWGYRDCAGHSISVAGSVSSVAVPPDVEWPANLVQYASDSAPNPLGIARLADGSVMTCGEQSGVYHLQPVEGFGPDNPAIDVAAGAGPSRGVVTASGEAWVKIGWSPVYEGLGVPANTWTRLELPEGAFAVGITINDASFQIRVADGALLTFGTSTQYQTGRGPSDTPGLGNDWRLLPAWVDGFVLDSVVEGWNAAALVIPDALVERTGWVPPQTAVAVSAVAATGPEGGTATTGVELSQPAAGDLTVSWAFEGETGTAVVPAGTTSAEIVVDLPEPDGVWGVDRELPLVLTGVDAGAVLADAAATVTVVDTDPPPVLMLAPASVVEGAEPLVGHTVTVTATGSVPGIDVPIALTSTDGTAVAGTDFKRLTFDLVLPALETGATAPLVVFGNAAPQPDRSLTLTATPDDERIAPATAGVTIVDDDPLALTATGGRVPAGQTATVALSVPSIPAGETVTVAWATLDLSAQAGVDYTAASGTVNLTGNAQGIGTATIPVATRVADDDGEIRHLLVALDSSHTTRDVFAPSNVIVELTRPQAAPPTTPASTTTTTTVPPARPKPPAPPSAPPSTPAPTPTVPTPPDAPFPPSRFVPLAPARLFDTRPGEPGAGPKGLVGPDNSIDIRVTGRLGIPANAVAVVLNVTVTDTTAASYVTVYPTGQNRPLASSINNVQPGQTRPNLVTVPIGDGGQITLYTLERAHLLADVAGYYLATDHAVAAGRFIALYPRRIFDTRPGEPAPGHKGKLAATETIRVQVAGVGDVPATGVAAVVINLTGDDATAAGYITAYPTGQDLPLASNVNLSGPGDTAPNLAIVPLGPDGAINIHSSHGTHALGDVTGYITDTTATSSTTGLFVPLHPTRVFDTRETETPPGPKGHVPAGGTINVQVAGTAGIPTTATGAVLNIVGINSPRGHLTIWPTGLDQPLASTLNFSTPPLDTRANAAMLPLSTNGHISIYTHNGSHILADTTGYYL